MDNKNKNSYPQGLPDRLRFSTTILRLLGEELNPSPDIGILELIKNAYDADAKRCTVELKGVHLKGGSIKIWDDGNGMDSDEIRNGWLVVGDSLKSIGTRSPSGRLVVGSKGLGRLGALRLGQKVTLSTRPRAKSGLQYRVELDWEAFNNVKTVEDIEIAIVEEEAPMGSLPGTEILITEIIYVWKKAEIERLARKILLLRDPFTNDESFKAVLKAPEFIDLERLAHSGYFSECDFHLKAEVNDEGRASAKVLTAGGKILFKADHNTLVTKDNIQSKYIAPAFSFELWEFLLAEKKFNTKLVTKKAVQDWLEQFGNVRLYHRGVRILPYGEPKNDWLDMNLRRVRSPEGRPSTNNSIGCIKIEDPKGLLLQKTDRLGFVDSESFDEVRRFAGDVLDWMARERLKERDRRKKSQIELTVKKKKEAETLINEALKQLPHKERESVESAIKQLRSAHTAEIELKDDTAQLYFTLGTIGTTAAAFAHQTKVPINGILQDANMLEHNLGDLTKLDLFREENSKAVKRIYNEANAIYSFSNVTLKLLEHEKRRSSTQSVHQLINDTIVLLKPYLEVRETNIELDYVAGDPKIWSSKAAFEAILTNLLTNSLQAFEHGSKIIHSSFSRLIHIRTRIVNEFISIFIQDNGPGIEKLSLDEIWIAGKTTTERGTGLGLAIVKDVVDDLHGFIEAEAHGEFGGASFTITLPIKI
ncbi:MAG: ATP-binding protein [Candidatus Heimdallarchaeota archaeon]|nr:ATP-binding protein [Candidatus Heimdallarchaeota archaeon]